VKEWKGKRVKECIHPSVARVAIAAALLLLCASSANAQADYRNLDTGRPIAVEDAQPIEYRGLESQWSIPRFTRERRGHWLVSIEPEFKWGAWKNLQFGLSSEYVIVRDVDRTIITSRDRQVHLLYNFNHESPRMPALAIRPEISIRTGGFGSQHEHAGVKLIASKTFHSNRIHINGSYTAGPTERRGRGGDLVSRYFYGIAYERTSPLDFVVLLADVYARKPIDHSPTEVVLEMGARVQIAPAWVLDVGFFTGALRPSVGPDFGFIFGLSRSFSYRFLHPKGDRK
jgi:hypothetical protein